MKLRSIYNLIRRNGLVEYADGDKEWYRHGQLHRDGGPAVEEANGYKAWYRNGKRHRDGVPLLNGVPRMERRSGGATANFTAKMEIGRAHV